MLGHSPVHVVKVALGILFSGVGMYTSLLLASIPSTGVINQFFSAVGAAIIGLGSVAAAAAIAWPKVMTTIRNIRDDLAETRENVQRNQEVAAENAARIAMLEKEAVVLREKARSADVRVHTAHKLAREAINLANAEVAAVRAEAAAQVAALKKEVKAFNDRYHETVKVVQKLDSESQNRKLDEEEAQAHKDDDLRKGAEPIHVVLDNLEKLADMDSMKSSGEFPVFPAGPKPEEPE